MTTHEAIRIRWPRFVLTLVLLDVGAIAVGGGLGLLLRLLP